MHTLHNVICSLKPFFHIPSFQLSLGVKKWLMFNRLLRKQNKKGVIFAVLKLMTCDFVWKYLYSEKDRLDVLVGNNHLLGCSFSLFSVLRHNRPDNLPHTNDLEQEIKHHSLTSIKHQNIRVYTWKTRKKWPLLLQKPPLGCWTTVFGFVPEHP